MNKASSFETFSIRLALFAGFLALLSVAAYRFGLVGFQIAVPGLALSALTASVAALLGIIALFSAMFQRNSAMRALIGILLGFVIAMPVLSTMLAGFGVPRIHDITTDLDHPPVFEMITELRTETDNALDRKTPENLAQLQREGYPDLKSLMLNRVPAAVFQHALRLVESRGWAIAAADAKKGIIEATASTPVMAFQDDVVIRIHGIRAGESQVDMRSVSRVGLSDLGANAQRIQRFLADLEQQLNEE